MAATGGGIGRVTAGEDGAKGSCRAGAAVGRSATGGDGGSAGVAATRFLGPTNQVVSSATGQRKKAKSPQPTIERPRW
jgi:hypothetical protein